MFGLSMSLVLRDVQASFPFLGLPLTDLGHQDETRQPVTRSGSCSRYASRSSTTWVLPVVDMVDMSIYYY